MTDKQPEALRLADWHKAMSEEPKRNDAKRRKHQATEAELRRLHEVNAELMEALQWIAAMTALPTQYQTLAKIVLAKAQGNNND